MHAMESLMEIGRGLANRRDPRLRDYIMQSSCVPLTAAMVAYLVLISYGPLFMKNRRSPPLKRVMTLYNIGQVCLSFYMMMEFWLSRPSNKLCSPIEVSDNSKAIRLANACWVFHISKLVDFLDTVFLVLKKDNKRLTYLHVYHHGSMAFGFWLCTLFVPGGSAWIAGVINSFVHCVMYGYYLLASLGPRVRPYLWWKRYLTQLQLAQFAFIVVAAWTVQMPSMRCGLPFWTCSMSAVYLVVLSALFLNFYRQSYGGPAAACGAIHPPQPVTTPTDVTPPAYVTEKPKTEPAPAPLPAPELEKPAEKSLSDYRVGTLNHFVRAMMSHGFGCFIKED
ncbi:elongation of very long chain fatty acids protein 2-like [Amphibalanus amphitrite]|uniref:elongation of very long chain fatty acids protein 2-like n=1 Tax=Amphibalanus amphitrite TaxID=1232801 RepID=UPI001C90FD8B|nr:elongation of very long chain fatty acids protein 2-like [Amphibalanus amphitrite]